MTKPIVDEKALMDKMRSSFPRPPVFSNPLEEREWRKFRLAQALRIFGNHGFDVGIAGHITVRDSIDPHSFWVNPFGLHFKLIQAEDLLLVNSAGEIQPESGPRRLLNVAAYMIHAKIHAARPDVICAAHSHSTYVKAFSALGRELEMISQDACAFYNDLATYDENRGITFKASEGEAIAEAIGSKKAGILRNHGAIVVTSSVEASVHYYIQLEKACEIQLLADSAAAVRGETTLKVSPEHAEANRKMLGDPTTIGWFAGLLEFDLLEQQEGKKFDLKKN